MSMPDQENAPQETPQAEAPSTGYAFLDDLADTSKANLERNDFQEIIDELTKDLTSTKSIQELSAQIEKLDEKLSEEVNRIIHHQKFQKLEGTWRGLQYLVANSITGADLKLHCFDMAKEELIDDAQEVKRFMDSELFKKFYLNRYATPGGVPFAAIVGDYEFFSRRFGRESRQPHG